MWTLDGFTSHQMRDLIAAMPDTLRAEEEAKDQAKRDMAKWVDVASGVVADPLRAAGLLFAYKRHAEGLDLLFNDASLLRIRPHSIHPDADPSKIVSWYLYHHTGAPHPWSNIEVGTPEAVAQRIIRHAHKAGRKPCLSLRILPLWCHL